MLRLCQAWVAVRTQRFLNRIPLWKRCATTMQLTHQSPCLAVCIAVSVCSLPFCFVGFSFCLAGWLLGWLPCWLVAWLLGWHAGWLAVCVCVCCIACSFLVSRLLVVGLAACMCRSAWLLAFLVACLASWLAHLLLGFEFSA